MENIYVARNTTELKYLSATGLQSVAGREPAATRGLCYGLWFQWLLEEHTWNKSV